LIAPLNPESLGVVHINQTGMGFYVIVQNTHEDLFSFDELKQYYDFSFNYDGNLVDKSLINENEKTATIRIEVRKCT
jgi:hypothetical protein